jgi:hypothetical protein
VELLNGMLSLAGKFMIGRWMSLLLFFRNCSQSLFKGGVKINCGRFLPKKELLRSKDFFKALPRAEGRDFP